MLGQRPAGLIDGMHPDVIVHTIILTRNRRAISWSLTPASIISAASSRPVSLSNPRYERSLAAVWRLAPPR
jgi:hypothetical protein